MISEPGGPFIDSSKLNLKSYAARPALAKVTIHNLISDVIIITDPL